MGLFSSIGKGLKKLVGGSGIGGALGATAGTLIGGPAGTSIGYTLGSHLGGAMSSGNETSAKKMWDYQFNRMTAWEKEKALNSRAWDMQGLLNAGLNPAIAGSAGDTLGGGSPNPNEWTGAQENNQINSGLRLMELAQAKEKMNAEIGQIQAETEATTLNNDTVRKYGDEKAKRELANTILQAGEIKANTALRQQQALSEMTNQIYTRALTQGENARTTGTSLDNAGKIRIEQWHDRNPNASKFLVGYNQFRPMTQDLMAAVGLAGTAKKAGDIAKGLSKSKITESYNKYGKFIGATKSWLE